MNAIQDEIIALHADKIADRVLNLSAYLALADANFSPATYGALVSTADGKLYMGIPLHEGDRLKSITFTRYGDGAADCDVSVIQSLADGTENVIGSTTVTNAAAAWADTTINVTDTTLAAGDTIWIYFHANAANWRLRNVRATYDHP